MSTILITGARRGIGRDSAFALAKRGHTVIATVRSSDQIAELEAQAASSQVSLTVKKLDITNADDISAFDFSAIDVLINNAATNESGPLVEVPIDRVEKLIETNIIGTLRITQSAAAAMLKRKSGRIVLLSSVAGRIVLPYLGPYTMTKFAVEAMGDALRMELLPHGIHVSLIEPGLIATGFNEEMAATKYDWIEADSAFAADIPKMKAHDEKITAGSYGTESIVAAIIDAVESSSPKARYTRPRVYQMMVAASRFLPTVIRDRVMRKFAGV